MMNDLIRDPANFYNHIKRVTASIACILVYGQRAPSYEDFWGHVSIVSMCRYQTADSLTVCV